MQQWKKTHQLTSEFDFSDKTFCSRPQSSQCTAACTCWHLNPHRKTLVDEALILDYIADKQLKYLTRPLLPSHATVSSGKEYCLATNTDLNTSRPHTAAIASLPLLSSVDMWPTSPNKTSSLVPSATLHSSSPSSTTIPPQYFSHINAIASNTFHYPPRALFDTRTEAKADTIESILQKKMDREKGKTEKFRDSSHPEADEMSAAAKSVYLHEQQQKKRQPHAKSNSSTASAVASTDSSTASGNISSRNVMGKMGHESQRNTSDSATSVPQPGLLPPLRDQTRILRLAGKSMWSQEEIRNKFPLPSPPPHSNNAIKSEASQASVRTAPKQTSAGPTLPPCLRLTHPMMLQTLYYHNQRADVTSARQRYRVLHSEHSLYRDQFGNDDELKSGKDEHFSGKEGSWCMYTHRQLEAPGEAAEPESEHAETEVSRTDEKEREHTSNSEHHDKSSVKDQKNMPLEGGNGSRKKPSKAHVSGPTPFSGEDVALAVICTDGHSIITVAEESICLELRRHLPLPPGSKIVIHNPVVTILDRALVANGVSENKREHENSTRRANQGVDQYGDTSENPEEEFPDSAPVTRDDSARLDALHVHLHRRSGHTSSKADTNQHLLVPSLQRSTGSNSAVGSATGAPVMPFVTYLVHLDAESRITVLRGKMPVLLKQYMSDARALARRYAKYDKLNVVSTKGFLKFKLTPKMIQYYAHHTKPETGLGSESLYKPKKSEKEEIPDVVNPISLTNPDCIGYVCLLDAGPPLFTMVGVPVVNVLNREQADLWMQQENIQPFSGSTFRTDNLDYSLLSRPVEWENLPQYPENDRLLSRTSTGQIVNPYIPSWLQRASESRVTVTAAASSNLSSASSTLPSKSSTLSSFAARTGALAEMNKEAISASVYGSNLARSGASFIPW